MLGKKEDYLVWKYSRLLPTFGQADTVGGSRREMADHFRRRDELVSENENRAAKEKRDSH